MVEVAVADGEDGTTATAWVVGVGVDLCELPPWLARTTAAPMAATAIKANAPNTNPRERRWGFAPKRTMITVTLSGAPRLRARSISLWVAS